MLKQLDAEEDAQAILSLSQFAFQYTLSEEAFEHKKQEARRHIIWGWMADDELAAKLHLIPLSCYINGQTFAMGGISSVATWPEYRRQGAVRQLLHHALHYMRQHGQTISFLHPFSFAFYRKYGWQHTFSEKTYAIPMTVLKRDWHVSGYVRRIGSDINTLQQVYTGYAKQFNGTLVRDDMWWQQRVLHEHWHKAVAYDASGRAEGYLLYNVTEGKVTVHELACITLNAKKLLLQFIANHDSMAETADMTVPENDNLPLLVDEPRFEQKLNPYFMARIVDIAAFLQAYPFKQGISDPVTLHVTDAFLPENNGIYQLSQTGDSMHVACFQPDTGPDGGVDCNVQQLTSMLMGYKRPADLYAADLIQGEPVQIEQLAAIIPAAQPFFPDFF